MDEIRIGIVAPYDLARAGGVGNQVRAQARALRRLGHQVAVFGPASAPLPEGETALSHSVSLTIHGTESGMGFNLLDAWRAPAMLNRLRFDVVHVHEPLTPLLPWFVLARTRAPLVGTFHVHREGGHRFYPVARPLLAPLIARLSARIAVSEAARRTVADHFPGVYEIVPNGIEVDEFASPRPRPATLALDRLHVLYVGRLEPRKGVDYLIQAMADVQRDVPTARLVVVGTGPEDDRLKRLARTCGADVTFLGHVSDEDLPGYFQWCDVAASPALGGESFGIVLIEAMACGIPLVASRIEGYTDVAGPADCGPLVPPADRGALAAALVPLLRDGHLRRVLGDRGRIVARQYDWSALAARLVSIYEHVRETVRLY